MAGDISLIGRPDVPASLQNLLAHGLAVDPAVRPPSAGVVAEVLVGIERDLGLPPTPADHAPPRPPAAATAAESPSGAAAPSDRARRAGVLTAAAVVLALLTGAGAAFVWRQSTSASSAAGTSVESMGPLAFTDEDLPGSTTDRTAPSSNASTPGAGGPEGQGPPVTTVPAGPPPLAVSACSRGNCAGRAQFVNNGERLRVCDNKGDDNYAVVAEYRYGSVSGAVWARQGGGTCQEQNVGVPAGVTFTFRVCLGDNAGNQLDCGDEATTRQ
jgi:hypothetical protein